MDRALVHTKSEIKDFDPSNLITVKNIPFRLVPESMFREFRPYSNPPTYERYLSWCDYFDKMPSYWNIALLDQESRMVAFQYGTWDPCGGEMHIIRTVIHPKYWRVSGTIIKKGIQDVKRLARELGMQRIYFITCRYKAFLRKAPEDLELMEARVLEVKNV